MIRRGQIAHDRCLRIPRHVMHDVDLLYTVVAEFFDVKRISHFEATSADILAVFVEKLLDVITLDRKPSVQSEDRTDRISSAQVPEFDFSNSDPMEVMAPLLLDHPVSKPCGQMPLGGLNRLVAK